MTELTTLFTSAKAAYEIAKGISSLKTEVEINNNISKLLEILISVQQDALSLQSNYSELLKAKDALEKKIIAFEKWEVIASQYSLTEISESFFVYTPNDKHPSPEPMHWLCTKCWEDDKKSILYLEDKGAYFKDYKCPECKNVFRISPDGKRKVAVTTFKR